ncbi:hypothetical protein BJ875DRAFT_444016 [Amylocarpus encephaloides]|uniref:Uncharacterized protein n=1 Tax=Amylocarpus encephaloides TaxID=45428 RepID=A0A9P8C2Z2_9HELO|nr:hypothetical protein BJ875DRAFT_444016 [Amylocarpus encephaloides]
MLQLRSFPQTFTSRRDDKQKEQSYSQDSSPDREPSLLPSATHHADVTILRDTRTPLVSLQERESDFYKNIARIRKIMKEEEELDSRIPRNEASVRVKIKHFSDYFQECNKAPLYEGPQALPPELESSIFRSRLETVWEGLMKLRMSQEWGKALPKSQSESWVSMIEEHTPKHVKSILASHQPPNIAQLESVEWSTTTAAGVYGWVLKPKGLLGHFDNEYYLWVGSASKYGGGLKSRKENLLSSSRPTQNEAPKPDIRNLGLSRTGKLITLLEVSFKDGSAEEVEKIRRLVTLAREVFVIWLVAAKDCSAIKEIVPWELEDILYHGLASHNLARNIK